LACSGFGWIAMRMVGIRRADGWPLGLGVGLGVLIFTGAVFNLLGIVKRPILISDIAIGVALFLFSLGYERTYNRLWERLRMMRPKSLMAKLWLGLIVLALLVRVGASVKTSSSMFNFDDDDHAYLAFPIKMLASGSFAPDPFSERRILNTLGGITYLQAISIAPTGDLRIINLVDGCFGLVLLFLFAVALCKRLELSMSQSLWVLTVLVLTPDMRVNATSVILPAALFLLLALIYLEEGLGDRLSWRRLLLFGLVAGTTCTLKSTAIPSTALFTIFLMGLELRRSGLLRVVRAGLTIAAMVLAVLLPWMIDSKAKCDTLLYPLLGRGYHVSAYMHTASSVGGTPAWLVRAVPLSLLFGLTAIVLFRRPGKERSSEWQVALAAVLTAAALPMLIGFLAQEEVGRYSITTLWAVNILVVAFFFTQPADTQKATNYKGLLFAYFALVFALVPNPCRPTAGIENNQLQWLRLVKASLLRQSGPMPESAHISEDRAMQQSIPVGAILLARTDESYGYDFRRNPIWIADYPGSASLPPGIPLNGDPEALDRYLLDHSIRYVAYSYANQANFPSEVCADRTSPAQRRALPMEAREAAAACTIQDDFVLLSKTHRHLFDNGSAYVLDLEE
jgi:hypothetical protein